MSSTMNHADQPDVCFICGKKIKKSDSDAQYHHDDLRGQHWSKHNKCKEE